MGNTKFDWAWACNDAPAWTNEEKGYFDHCIECLKQAATLTNDTGIYQCNRIGNLMSGAFKAFQMASYRYNTNVEIAEKFAALVKAAYANEI